MGAQKTEAVQTLLNVGANVNATLRTGVCAGATPAQLARQFLMQKPSKAANDVLALFGGAPVTASSKQKNQTEGKPWWATAASGTRETAASKPVPGAACCSPSLRFAEAKRRAI